MAAPRARAASSRSAASESGLQVTAIPAPGKRPLHLEGPAAAAVARGQRRLRHSRRGRGARLAYFSGIAGPSPEVEQALADADVVFFDGTFWSSDELVAAGLGTRTRRGDGALADRRTRRAACDSCRAPARTAIYIHINNTNPILHEDSAERRAVVDAGIEIAHDGLELEL